MIFKYSAFVSGNYSCLYVFENSQQLDSWTNSEFKKLKNQYGNLLLRVEVLDQLKIGDKCHVNGDGNEIYQILDITKFDEYQYGFILDTGFVENVAKCFKVIN